MKWLKNNPEKLVTTLSFVALLVLLVTVSIYVAQTAITANRMGAPFIFFLLLFAIGIPLFITFGVFSIYRHNYIQEHPERADQVAWNKYLVHMVTLIGVMALTAALLIWRDSAASEYFAQKSGILPSLVLGRGSLPLYFSSGKPYKAIFYPTTMFWWAYLGAITNITQIILRRYSTGHLVAKSYLFSALRVIISMFAAALIFAAFHAWPYSFGSMEDNLVENWHILSILAFFAGVFPNSVIYWVNLQTRKILKIGGRDNLPLTEIQGIDAALVHILNDEGIWTVTDLAYRSAKSLAADIQIDTETVRNWQNQAKLLAQLKNKRTIKHFGSLGIHSWDDLIILRDMDIPKAAPEDLLNPPNKDEPVPPALLYLLQQKSSGAKQ